MVNISNYSLGQLPRNKDNIRLHLNENPYGPSPSVKKIIRQVTKGIHLYPNNLQYELKKKLAAFLKLTPEQIFLSNGSDRILLLISYIFAKNKEILSPQYSFILFPLCAKFCGAKYVSSPVNNFKVDIEALINAVSNKTTLIFIANPNNPTGTYLSQNEFEYLLKKISEKVIVVIDEAYYEFAAYYLKHDFSNSIALLKKHPNVIITRTFSKAYGLAGLRIGYAIADPRVVQKLNSSVFPYDITEAAILVAKAALDDQAFLYDYLDRNKNEMVKLSRFLDENNIIHYSSPANYIMLDFKKNAKYINTKLLQKRIQTYLLHAYKLNSCLRISVGTPKENARFMEALSDNLFN